MAWLLLAGGAGAPPLDTKESTKNCVCCGPRAPTELDHRRNIEQDVYNTAVQAEKPPWKFTKSHAEATIGRGLLDVSQEKTKRVRAWQSQHHVAWDRTPQRVLVLAKRTLMMKSSCGLWG